MGGNGDVNEAKMRWSFIPKLWRHWWIKSSDFISLSAYGNISIDYPEPFVVDRTRNLSLMRNLLEENTLGSLMEACSEKFLLPNVLCPWGCSEYIHCCGLLPFDLVLQRFFRKESLGIVTSEKDMKLVEYCRDDYIREDRSYDNLLENEAWTVRPTVVIDCEKGAVVMTCSNHDKGCKKMYLHTPRHPRTMLLPLNGERLTHVVLKPRTIKSMKISKYNHTYQMQEQRGDFRGVDTADVTCLRDFGTATTLLDESEALSITHRSDIKALLSQFVIDGEVPSFWAKDRCEVAKRHALLLQKKGSKHAFGATFVSLKDVLDSQKYMRSDQRIDVFDANRYVKTDRIWPRIIYPLQKFDEHGYGSKFACVPSMQFLDFSAWKISALLCCVKNLWAAIDCNEKIGDMSWYGGWLLSYLASECFVGQFTFRRGTHSLYSKDIPADIVPLSLSDAFADCSSVVVFVSQEKSLNEAIVSLSKEFENSIYPSIIIFERGKNCCCESWKLQKYITFGDELYKLRTYVVTKRGRNRRLGDEDGEIFSCHGGSHYVSWWRQTRYGKVVLQENEGLFSERTHGEEHVEKLCCAVYVTDRDVDVETSISQYKSYMGVNDLVLCQEHHVPMIVSACKNVVCALCKRDKVFFECAVHGCRIKVCKR